MADYFELFQLPRQYALSLADLERAYLTMSREIHPDRHQQGSTAEQSASVELSAQINEAYLTLRDPLKRAEYLFALAGGPSASTIKDVPLDFLDEMLDLRMEIAAMQPDTPSANAMEEQLSQRRDTMLVDIGRLLDQPSTEATQRQTRQQLNAVKYLMNLLRDLRAL